MIREQFPKKSEEEVAGIVLELYVLAEIILAAYKARQETPEEK